MSTNEAPSTASSCSCMPPAPVTPRGDITWLHDPDVEFLNHGSFGARPAEVCTMQDEYRRRYEAQPILVLDRERGEDVLEAMRGVAQFVRSDPHRMGFVTNTTEGINGILRSMTFHAGDELLTTTHVYNAIRQTMSYLARRVGADYTEVNIELPLSGPQECIDAIIGAISERTKVVVLDHITSPTAVIHPIEPIIAHCKDRGIPIIIDGAHAPGMVDLNLDELNPTFYVANLHKWTCAPSGAAFLRVAPEWTEPVHPTTISHFLGEGLEREFEWQGTRDISPWIVAPQAIEFFEQRIGWDAMRTHNCQLACWAQQMLHERTGLIPATPLDGSMIGCIASLEIAGDLRNAYETPEDLMAEIYKRTKIEIPVMLWNDRWWIRHSAQIYNHPEQYEKLADVLVELMAEAKTH